VNRSFIIEFDRMVIEIDWERLEQGPPEERATFGAIGIRFGNRWLSEAHDSFVNRVRQKVHLSGYQLAQWLAWNWWRLRWEPSRESLEWRMAHHLSNIGGGYVWPNITCTSDGERVLMRALPTQPRPAEPLRYLADTTVVLPALEFEAEIERYIGFILEKLRTEGVNGTNLENIWAHVTEERRDSESSWYRRLEAALGCDPDEASEQVLTALIGEEKELGRSGVAELAAGSSGDQTVPSSNHLKELAASVGYEINLGSIPLITTNCVQCGPSPWEVGENAARLIRKQMGLNGGVFRDKKLAELAGTGLKTLTDSQPGPVFQFALRANEATAKVVLKSPINTNRRFALARVVGDRILNTTLEPLIPVLRSYSYRQKLQRAFAGELLCPFEHALQMLNDDFSDENQEYVAHEFQVSQMVVSTKLVNEGILPRQALSDF